jgi:HK97 gp10 family phage protein
MGISARATFKPRNDIGQFIQGSIAPAVVASVTASCKLIEDSAKGYCPVDTGALRDSITSAVSTSGSTTVGIVAPHMPYAEYVEYGTGRSGDPSVPHVQTILGQKPQPYMRPAFDENKDAVKEIFRGQIALALRK